MSNDIYKNNILWFLEELKALDDDQIEGGWIDVEVADADGNEGFTSLSVKTIAQTASEEITRIRKAVSTAIEMAVECTDYDELSTHLRDLGRQVNG